MQEKAPHKNYKRTTVYTDSKHGRWMRASQADITKTRLVSHLSHTQCGFSLTPVYQLL